MPKRRRRTEDGTLRHPRGTRQLPDGRAVPNPVGLIDDRGEGGVQYRHMLKCLKCEGEIPITSKSLKYCSVRCSTLFLKSQWKKRTREKRNAYNRAYRKLGKRHPTSASRASLVSRLGGKCERCESRNKIDLHHIRPLRFGGTNETRNLLLLCKPCHQLWHTRLDSSFWQQKKEV